MTVFANKASDLFSLPETFVVRNLPVQTSEYQLDNKEVKVTVFSAELTDLQTCMKK